MATLRELRDERVKKLNTLKDMGILPFPSTAKKDFSNNEIIENFSKYENKELSLTGRLVSLRTHGQVVFADLSDFSGKIQLYIKEANILPTNTSEQIMGFSELHLLDIGDFVQAEGKVTKTKSGEKSLLVKKLKLLTKSIRPMPDKHEGLKDRETIFRRRYLDLTINSEKRELFIRKAKFWRFCREFLHREGFIEVETPILEHFTGGADAKPFTTHHDALDEDFYLRISTELFQKRLIGGGFEKVFTLGPNFRNEGLSDEHLQEYYQLEWYWAYANYRDNMILTEKLFREVAQNVYGKTKFTKNEYTFDLSQKWEEIDYTQSIKNKFNIDVFKTSDEEIIEITKKHNISLEGAINRNRLIDNLWKIIRKEISGPAFLINHPKFISPLAKSSEKNGSLTERFQIIIAGSELGNGYSELNDPFDQLDRFLEQQEARNMGDAEAQMLDIDFVEMLEYGMPPTSGFGLSERLFWFLEDITAREGTLFPQLRGKIEEITKEIYGIQEQKNDKDNEGSGNSKLSLTKETAENMLREKVKDDYQILHAKMVAASLEEYAKKFGADPEFWYITGLLHDLDYFEYPDEHPAKEVEWFKQWAYPAEFIHAIEAHAHRLSGVEPKSTLAAALIAVDELAGFLYAYSLMRPEGFWGMEAKAVRKKFKDKAFAKKIDRDDINYGIEKFGVDFEEHVNFLINVYQHLNELRT